MPALARRVGVLLQRSSTAVGETKACDGLDGPVCRPPVHGGCLETAAGHPEPNTGFAGWQPRSSDAKERPPPLGRAFAPTEVLRRALPQSHSAGRRRETVCPRACRKGANGPMRICVRPVGWPLLRRDLRRDNPLPRCWYLLAQLDTNKPGPIRAA